MGFFLRFTTRLPKSNGKSALLGVFITASLVFAPGVTAQPSDCASAAMLPELKRTCIKAEEIYALGEKKRKNNDHKGAISLFRKGIALIGNSYYTVSVLDDSDLHVALAFYQEKQGKFSVAARLLGGVLHDRLASLREKKSE